MNKIKILLTCILLSATSFCFAQLSTEEKPYSWHISTETKRLSAEIIPTITLPAMNMEEIRKEDAENEKYDMPFRFGYSHFVNLNTENSGTWSATPNGGKLWKLKIVSPDTNSLNLVYDKFWLPEGGKLFIYTPDQQQYMGAFTALNNIGTQNDLKGFGSGLIYDKEIIIEYYEPEGVSGGIINISEIITGYRELEENPKFQTRSNNTDLNCHIDVNCTNGSTLYGETLYKNNVRSVVYIVMGGYACSGALINTTANDNRPYFLTAYHCYENDPSSWIFYFHYETPLCGGVVETNANKSVSGAKILASGQASDFLLLELKTNPSSNANITPFYAGWDNRDITTSSSSAIHHPKRAQKKVSIDANPTVSSGAISWSDGTTSPANSHWTVKYTEGAMEKGSSGSPLFNKEGKIIGQLHGGQIYCPPNNVARYGKLSYSWNTGTTSATRLKDWLDPLNTSATTMNGSKKLCTGNKTFTSTISSSQTINGCNIEFSGTINNNATVIVNAEGIIRLKPGFRATQGTTIRMNAHVLLPDGSYANERILGDETTSIHTEDIAGTQSSLSQNTPNPFNENTLIQCHVPDQSESASIRIINVHGQIIKTISKLDKGKNEISLESAEFTPGIYIYSLIIDNQVTHTKRMIILR